MSGIAPIVYLNGEYVAREKACLPITDRGLLFGDSVYEVVMAYGGKLFHLWPGTIWMSSWSTYWSTQPPCTC